MLRVDDIKSFDTLKQAAELLESAVSKLAAENAQLRLEIARLDGTARTVDQCTMLEEELAKLRARCFAPSSEKRQTTDPEEQSTGTGQSSPATNNGHGPTPQPLLEVVEKTFGLETRESTCDDCGKPRLPKEGLTQESEMITVTGVEFKLMKVTQLIYGCECPDTLVTAPGPVRVTPGGRYSLELAAFAAAQKYLDHMPLARLQRMMDRNDLQITRSTIWDQINALAGHLEPSWLALHQYTLGADWAHCDETYWPMLDGPGSSKWWAWCLTSADAVFYDIHRSRSAKAAKAMLNGFEGVLITDGYSAYDAVLRAGPPIIHAHCWAHVRRKFIEAEAAYPKEVKEPLHWIGTLFRTERTLPPLERGAPLAERRTVCETRRALRDTHSRPVINKLREWAYAIHPTLLPSMGLTKAIDYMLKLWPGLTVFLDDPRVPIDNNHAEREIRGVVVGRKNHYGSKSKRGTVVAAIFYSLFESAKLIGVNPEQYVLEAARRAISCPGTVTLPHDLFD